MDQVYCLRSSCITHAYQSLLNLKMSFMSNSNKAAWISSDQHCHLITNVVWATENRFHMRFCGACFLFVHFWLVFSSQLSKVTHFIDASSIYGSDLKTQAEVRSFRGGRVRMLEDFGRELLPLTIEKEACVSLEKGPCFFAGEFLQAFFFPSKFATLKPVL